MVVVFYVFFPALCTLGAPKLKKEKFHNMILLGLANGDSRTLPRELNMMMWMVQLRV
ncbi:hypothetical protein I3842_11G083600 [Carya illinoinensis]|uniref:Uncharacterized protein n=1 Tax=Carya illinoinensis TaxID=32201 RepID=A0A922DNG1_CARIL|nr:hypothetical protein I3842_11G083600 [Carya illinoinensis]